jgi:hypothetical protein
MGELQLDQLKSEGRRLLEQARAAADELGMPGLTKRAVAYEYEWPRTSLTAPRQSKSGWRSDPDDRCG